MKVFFNLQLSNTTTDENGNKKWRLQEDGGVNVCRGVVSALLDYTDDISFVIKLPALKDVADIKSYSSLFDEKQLRRIVFYEDELPPSPVEARFTFNFNYHKKNRAVFSDVDVCINDEATLTKNWIVLFESLGLDIPIISINYFLDSPYSKKVPDKISYYERQMESVRCADLVVSPCKAARYQLYKAYDHSFSKPIDKKISIWNIAASKTEVEKYSQKKKNVPVIFFGNRVTDTADRYTNWHVFAKAIGIVAKTKWLFDAYILNPTKKITGAQYAEIMSLSEGNVIINTDKNFSRVDYLNFINSAHIGCSLFTNEVHGGTVHAESLLAGDIVVAPDLNNYSDVFGNIFLE